MKRKKRKCKVLPQHVVGVAVFFVMIWCYSELSAGVLGTCSERVQARMCADFLMIVFTSACDAVPCNSPHRSRDEEELLKQFKARPMPGGRSSSVGR